MLVSTIWTAEFAGPENGGQIAGLENVAFAIWSVIFPGRAFSIVPVQCIVSTCMCGQWTIRGAAMYPISRALSVGLMEPIVHIMTFILYSVTKIYRRDDDYFPPLSRMPIRLFSSL